VNPSPKITSYVDSSLPSIPIKPMKKNYYDTDENATKKIKKDEPEILDLSFSLETDAGELPGLSKSSIVTDKPTSSGISRSVISMPSDKMPSDKMPSILQSETTPDKMPSLLQSETTPDKMPSILQSETTPDKMPSLLQSETTPDKMPSDKMPSILQSETTPDKMPSILQSENPYTGNATLSENPYTGNATLSENPYTGNVTLSENPSKESFKNMETSQIIDAYPFTVNQTTIPSKFYTKYNYKLPSKNVDKSFFSEFFSNLLTTSEIKKENFTDNIEIPYQNQYQNNKYSQTYETQKSPKTQTLSPQTEDDYQMNQFQSYEPIKNKQIDQFRKSYCINHQLTYKNTPVRSEIAEHIFPNLQVNGLAGSNGVKCNPCDTSCPIFLSSRDQRLENENIIQKRIRPEYKTQNWEPKFFDVFLPNPNYPDLNHSNKNDNRSYLIPSNARIMPF